MRVSNGWVALYGFLVLANGIMLITDGTDKSQLLFLAVGAFGLGIASQRRSA